MVHGQNTEPLHACGIRVLDLEGIRREITRHNFKPPDANKYSEVSPGWWAESTRPPLIFMRALHPSSDQWNHRWGKTFMVGPRGIDSWELWPRGPVRTVSLGTNEYVGAKVIISPDRDASKRSPQATIEEIDYCHLCARAAEMTDLWNQFKVPESTPRSSTAGTVTNSSSASQETLPSSTTLQPTARRTATRTSRRKSHLIGDMTTNTFGTELLANRSQQTTPLHYKPR